MLKEKISQFIQILAKINSQGIWDMGLVTAEGDQKQEAIDAIKAEIKDLEVFDFGPEISSGNFLLALIKSLQDKKWLAVNLSGGRIDGQIYGQLRRLATTNRLQILNWQDEAEFNLKQSEASRIIFIASWPGIEALNLPEFTQLFGPALDLAEARRNQ